MSYIGAGISRFNTADELTVTGDATIDTTTLVVDSTNNRVGILNASPTTALDVTGTVTADGIDIQGDGTISGGSRLTISDIADENNDGIRLDDSTTSRFNNLTQDSSGNFKIQHWTGSAWQNNLTLTTGGNLGIGTASPDALLQIEKSDSGTTINKEPSSQSGPNIAIHNSNQTANNLSSVQFTNRGTNGVAETATAGIHVKHEAQGGTYSYGSMNFNTTSPAGSYAHRMSIDGNGRVSIAPDGTAAYGESSADNLTIYQTGANVGMTIRSDSNRPCGIYFADGTTGNQQYMGYIEYNHNTDLFSVWGEGALRFGAGGSEKARFDSNGTFLVGKTSDTFSSNGTALKSSGEVNFTRTDAVVASIRRSGTNGNWIEFYDDSTMCFVIGTVANSVGYLGSHDTGLVFEGFFNDCIIPFNPTSQGIRDNLIALGYGSSRFSEIFCANSTINTSDETEKQDIATLTSAEMAAAKSISALFKTYKWKDAVAAKGDAARIHTGVIAQDVQAAMSAAGLDAAKYSFWCSDTWWEAEETITKEDGEKYVGIVPYQTAEDAPKGATKRTRLGIRYAELLAFIGAATEQRLADIESRLAALEE